MIFSANTRSSSTPPSGKLIQGQPSTIPRSIIANCKLQLSHSPRRAMMSYALKFSRHYCHCLRRKNDSLTLIPRTVDPVEYRATTSNMWPPTELLCLLSAMVILGAIGTFGDTAAQSAEMPTSTLSSEIAETEDKFETMTKQFRRLAARRILPIASEIMSDPRFSPRCAGAFLKLRGAITENEMWVLQSESFFSIP